MSCPVQKTQCKTCIFREDGNELPLREGRLAEIRNNVVNGVNQQCHSNERKVCRGGRDFSLMIWNRLGYIDAPTDAALETARRRLGVLG